MINSFLNRISLRPLREGDIGDDYVSWFSDAVVTEFLDSSKFTKEDTLAYMEHGRATNTYYMYAVIDLESNVHIGNVKVGPINWLHMTSDLITVIGRREYWGKGYAVEAIKAGNKIAFETYKMRKLCGGIADGNEGSLKAYTRAGWVEEARLKGHHLINGEPRDRIVVSCFNPAFFPQT